MTYKSDAAEAKMVRQQLALPPGKGFFLLVWDEGQKNIMTYSDGLAWDITVTGVLRATLRALWHEASPEARAGMGDARSQVIIAEFLMKKCSETIARAAAQQGFFEG